MPAQSGTAQNSTMAQQGDASMPQPGSTNALHTNAFTFTYEPAFSIAYRF
jgi:hypothetical protein